MSQIPKIPAPYNETINNFAPNSTERAQIIKELKHQESSELMVPNIVSGKALNNKDHDQHMIPHNNKKTCCKIAKATPAQSQEAIESCLIAQKSWSQLAWQDRASVFLKAADLLTTKYRAKINAATMHAQSKTCFQAEVDAVCELADFWRFNAKFAENIYAQQPLYSPKGQWNRTQVRALEGFVFAPGPFNFTSISANLATAPALMGTSVLWKPSPAASLASWMLLEILQEAGLPDGVINFINGDPSEIAKVVLTHPKLAGVHFTGSTKTFEHIWQQISNNLNRYQNYPRLVGETGGKDFIFAHQSADPQALVTAMIRGAFEYQGQKCSAASRAYIPSSLWQKIKTPLADLTNSIKMGAPNDLSNFMCSVIDKKSYDKVKGFIDHCKQESDTDILCGGECDDQQGYYIRPTIAVCKNPKAKSMQEEAFGPLLSVYVYPDKDLQASLELCNSSNYALTGAIFARDRHVIESLSTSLKYAAGNFYINDKPTGAVVGQQPFGGSRKSGTNDKAGSEINLLKWASHRTIKENFIPAYDYRYPHMS
jgi:1-pyrroline-5-carboxylate dehydrogenase